MSTRHTVVAGPVAGAGFQMLQLAIALAILVAGAAVLTPPLLRWTDELRVELAAQEIAGALRLARSAAVRLGVNVAIKFVVEDTGRVYYAIYRDGDGDGVRNRDIESGVDPQVAPPHPLNYLGNRVGFGFPPGQAPRDPGDPSRNLRRLQDPIRFNRSDLASFNPLGGSTPGSVYLTDGRYHLIAVRVLGTTGRVKTMRWDPETRTWRQ